MEPADGPNRELGKRAYRNFLAGRFGDAVKTQLKVVNALLPEKSLATANALKRLALYLFMLPDYQACARALSAAAEINSGDPEINGNLGIALLRLQRYREAIPCLEKAIVDEPNSVNWLDGITRCYGKLGDDDAARGMGQRALRLKAQAAEAAATDITLPSLPPLPNFDPHHSECNIIAYSLWGDNPRYLEGALRNARLAPDLYPGWTCRFYLNDSVPSAAVEALRSYGPQIVRRPKPQKFYEGLLWRFEVMSDPAIRRFLIRDADSLLGAREKVAVDAWLLSDRHFHVMRDFYSHTELILAGMWGGVGGILPSVEKLLESYRLETAPTSNVDQLLLRTAVWPRIRNSVLIHDSWFRLPNTLPFPDHAWGNPGTHVGQNFSVTARAQEEPRAWDPSARGTPVQHG